MVMTQNLHPRMLVPGQFLTISPRKKYFVRRGYFSWSTIASDRISFWVSAGDPVVLTR